jgi:hypothetical protein
MDNELSKERDVNSNFSGTSFEYQTKEKFQLFPIVNLSPRSDGISKFQLSPIEFFGPMLHSVARIIQQTKMQSINSENKSSNSQRC